MQQDYEEELPKHMEKMEKLLMRNDGGDGYFVGDEVHYNYMSHCLPLCLI